MYSRETGFWAKLGFMDYGVDARAGVVIIVWAVHMMWSTFYIMIGLFAFLGIIQWFGMTPFEFIRRSRRFLAGNYIHVRRFNRLLS